MQKIHIFVTIIRCVTLLFYFCIKMRNDNFVSFLFCLLDTFNVFEYNLSAFFCILYMKMSVLILNININLTKRD